MLQIEPTSPSSLNNITVQSVQHAYYHCVCNIISMSLLVPPSPAPSPWSGTPSTCRSATSNSGRRESQTWNENFAPIDTYHTMYGSRWIGVPWIRIVSQWISEWVRRRVRGKRWCIELLLILEIFLPYSIVSTIISKTRSSFLELDIKMFGRSIDQLETMAEQKLDGVGLTNPQLH